MDEEKPLSSDQIKDNVDILKRKLRKDTSPLYQCLYSAINEALICKLTWKNPLASQVISNRSDISGCHLEALEVAKQWRVREKMTI